MLIPKIRCRKKRHGVLFWRAVGCHLAQDIKPATLPVLQSRPSKKEVPYIQVITPTTIQMKTNLPLYLALLLLTQCSKCKNDPAPVTPADQLPPATQTGANTFGCLLNGQPFTPSGFNGTPNFLVSYDPGFQGGNLDVRVYRNVDKAANKQQFIRFGGDQIIQPGTYILKTPADLSKLGPYTASFSDYRYNSPCDMYSFNPGTTTEGRFTVTRLDLQAGIVSGTFEFTLAQPGCQTIVITQGRFDKKIR